jgi:hypothetical protein
MFATFDSFVDSFAVQLSRRSPDETDERYWKGVRAVGGRSEYRMGERRLAGGQYVRAPRAKPRLALPLTDVRMFR